VADGPGSAMVMRWAAVVACSAAIAGWAMLDAPCVRALTAEQVLAATEFSAAEQASVLSGHLVSGTRPSSTPRELAVAIGVEMKQPVAPAVTMFRKGAMYHRDPSLIAYGKIVGAGTPGDFARLTLGPNAAEAARGFLTAAAGEELNLSADEIAAFTALNAPGL